MQQRGWSCRTSTAAARCCVPCLTRHSLASTPQGAPSRIITARELSGSYYNIVFTAHLHHAAAAAKGTVRRQLAAPVIFTAKSNSFLTDTAVFTPVRFVTFSEACRQTLVLYESADSDSCSSSSDESVLQSRVDVVNAACCEHGGVNTCVGGAPQTCKLASGPAGGKFCSC